MKKTTKLLSVILAFVMALSCMSMMASAAKASYKTVADLEGLNAYSPYGTVTRLTTEERMSIVFDSLDLLLAEANINMGQVVDTMGLSITINLTSIDNLCTSFDSFKSTMSSGTYGFAKAFFDLGILEDLSFSTWQSGMSRAGTAQMTIVNEIMKLLSNNTDAVSTVLTSGIKLGLISRFVNINISSINALVVNLPKLVNGIVLPLFSRQDDDATQRGILGNTSSTLLTVAEDFVNGLFTKPMNWTSYREDAAGTDLGYTTALPMGTEAGTSRYFVRNGDSITQYDYKYAGVLGGDDAGYYETVTYTKDKEFASDDCTTYVFRAPDWYDGDATLKWYKADGFVEESTGRIQSSYWLPTVKEAMDAGTLSIKLNDSTKSVLGMVYDFIPYIFAELAPTVLNGSAKKLIAEAFDVDFTKIGVKVSAEVAAVAAATGNPDNFFTKDQEYYTWEYSDYKVINGTPYYRYQDQYFVGTIPSNISAYYNMINWDWKIDGTFFDEFVPTSSQVTQKYAVDSLNAIVAKAINTLIVPSWTSKGTTYNRSEVFEWSTANGNADILNNLMATARNLFMIAPEEIVDEYYAEAQFYDAMMNGTLEQAVNGLICELTKLIMPQISYPDNIVDQPITAILAVVVRELCTQLMPSYDFDAMIYTNYNTRALASHTAQEWLDISLYMGVNLGMYYLRNIADIGENDATNGYYAVMKNLGAIPASTPDGITFTATSYQAQGTASWLVMVDWIVDWALSNEVEWAWHFERFVDAGTVSLTTYENPFNKINAVLLTFIPDLETLLNISDNANFASNTYGSGTWLEKLLKGGLVDSIMNLDVPALISAFHITSSSVLAKGYIADTLVQIVVNMLNKITFKVGKPSGASQGVNIIPTTGSNAITSVSTLLNHANLKNVVINLVGRLYAASSANGLFDPVLPIANFFIGWTTDPQKFADPSVRIDASSGRGYLLKTGTNRVVVVNTSSGMLLKHRNSATTDSPYSIKVTNITCDNGVTVAFDPATPVSIAPGGTEYFDLTTPSGEGVTKITINYEFAGKDSEDLGGTQEKVYYAFFTETQDQEYVEGRYDGDDDNGYTGIDQYARYQFTKDIYGTVTGSKFGIFSVTSSDKYYISKMELTGVNNDSPVTAPASNYFAQITYSNAKSVGEWPSSVSGSSSNPTPSVSGYIYVPQSGVTADTEFPYGVYDMGVIAVKYKAYEKRLITYNGEKAKTWEIDYVYYDDYDIDSVRDEYVGKSLKATDFPNTTAAQDAFAEYETALRNVVRLADYPKMATGEYLYTTYVMPQIEPAIEALEAAYDKLTGYASSSSSSVDTSVIKEKLDSLETLKDSNGFQKDINFQEYALFEYFQYEKQRTSARKMIKSVTAPEEPQAWIENGVYGDDIVAAVLNSTSDNVKKGVNATVIPKDMKDPDYLQALADFRPASYTDLEVENQVAMLQYYYNFMVANPRNADLTFLNKEIATAEAKFGTSPVNTDNYYSTDSWNRYVDAYTAAKAITAASKESEAFDAKYELMVAMNKLQRADRSMKESGYLDEELNPAISKANFILDNYTDGTGIIALKSGVTESEALAQLVQALGVRYDITVDGCHYEGILYNRPAYSFTDYDRTATIKNKKAVDAAVDKLEDALANFVVRALEAKPDDDTTTVETTVQVIDGITPGSIKNTAALLNHVQATITGATTAAKASKSGYMGTGAKVDVNLEGVGTVATYVVVIYGDVNGDGAIDAFDAISLDLAVANGTELDGAYALAADVDNSGGKVGSADYAALSAAVCCDGVIEQTR